MSNKVTTEFIWFNGKFVPWADAKVSVMTHALHYGTSVFEGIRAYKTNNGTVVFRLKDHMQRLLNSGHIYGIEIPYTKQELCDAVCDTIKKNKVDFGYIRPLSFIGDVGLGVKPPKDFEINTIIGIVKWGAYLSEEGMKKGVTVGISSWHRLAPDTIPTGAKAGGNYLSSLLISNEAKKHGYDEGIALDVSGYLAEGSGENVFLVKDNVLYTSTITCGILPGITRDCVIKLAGKLGYKVSVERIPREAIYLADEVFMTGSAAEITPVREVDGYKIGTGSRGSVTESLQKAFFGLFNGTTKDEWNWLYPVK